MKIFLTGGSGFVGGAVASALTAEHRVVAMARSEESAAKIVSRGAEPVRCELGAVEPEHLEGSDVVIHAAAKLGDWGPREKFWRVNVDGTSQLLDTARAAGVKRFIHISTEAVLFRGQHLRQVEETHPYPERSPILYSETKAAAEKRVLAADGPALTTLALRPRLVWGPGDTTLLAAIARAVEQGSYLWLDGGRARTSTTFIGNLTHAVKLALARGRGGKAYFITDGETTTLREFLTTYLGTQGIELPKRSLPGGVIRPAARLTEGTWRLLRLGGRPAVTFHGAAFMSRDCTLLIDNAERDLDYRPLYSIAEGMARM